MGAQRGAAALKTCGLCGADHLVPLDSAVVERAARWLDGYLHQVGQTYYSLLGEADKEAWRVEARCLLSCAFGNEAQAEEKHGWSWLVPFSARLSNLIALHSISKEWLLVASDKELLAIRGLGSVTLDEIHYWRKQELADAATTLAP